jgi:hypothetical protein
MTTVSSVIASMPRQRVPRGAAPKKLRVALPPHLLELVERDAEREMRTLSAQAATCIAKFYAQQEKES